MHRACRQSHNHPKIQAITTIARGLDSDEDVEPLKVLESLVRRILDLHKQRDSARTDQDKQHLQRLIDATDNQIDQLVYELYDLTDDEVAIVEGEFA